MTYSIEMNGKDVIVSHPQWHSGPQVMPGWTWQAALVRQLIAERDEARAAIARIESESATMTVGAKWPKGL